MRTPLPTSTEPGTLVQGHRSYRIERRLGQGASAEVFLTTSTDTGAYCVVKLLRNVNTKGTARFVQEAKVMAEVDHPGVVDVLDVGVYGGRPFLVMPYASRGTLSDALSRFGGFPADLALDVILQVADAAHAAHKRGVVHRDIKPQNVLVTTEGELLLADFGTARLKHRGVYTRTGTSMGTLGFVAPEQLEDASRADARSDQYGLGSTLLALLTGCLPGNAFMDVRWEGLDAAPVPRALLRALRTACAYRPHERYRDVRALQTTLYEARRYYPAPPIKLLPLYPRYGPDLPALPHGVPYKPGPRRAPRPRHHPTLLPGTPSHRAA